MIPNNTFIKNWYVIRDWSQKTVIGIGGGVSVKILFVITEGGVDQSNTGLHTD